MMRTFHIAGLITLFAVISFGQAAESQPPQSDEETIRALEMEYSAAFVKKDWDTIERLIAEEYTVTGEKGQMTATTKASVMRGLRAEGIEYISSDVSGLEISISGDVATVRGSLEREVRNRKTGAAGFQEGKYLRTWKRKDNQWRIIGFQGAVKDRVTVQPKKDPVVSEPVISSVSAQKIQKYLFSIAVINTPVYETSIKLSIYGRDLGGGGATVYINGKDVTKSITLQNHSLIVLEDSQKALGLSDKSENRIELLVNGKRANVYSFSQRF